MVIYLNLSKPNVIEQHLNIVSLAFIRYFFILNKILMIKLLFI